MKILRVLSTLSVVAGAALVTADPGAVGWPQWGGPRGDFTVATTDLAARWPEKGPSELWRRPLGGGYSGIVVQDGRAYTSFRRGGEEVVIALATQSGDTIWQDRYAAKAVSQQTPGPPVPLDRVIPGTARLGPGPCVRVGFRRPGHSRGGIQR